MINGTGESLSQFSATLISKNSTKSPQYVESFMKFLDLSMSSSDSLNLLPPLTSIPKTTDDIEIPLQTSSSFPLCSTANHKGILKLTHLTSYETTKECLPAR